MWKIEKREELVMNSSLSNNRYRSVIFRDRATDFRREFLDRDAAVRKDLLRIVNRVKCLGDAVAAHLHIAVTVVNPPCRFPSAPHRGQNTLVHLVDGIAQNIDILRGVRGDDDQYETRPYHDVRFGEESCGVKRARKKKRQAPVRKTCRLISVVPQGPPARYPRSFPSRSR